MSQFINSIKRKLPDRIDIFNKKNETEFVAQLKSDFTRIIDEELAALSNFLPVEIARNTINDNFNYTEEDGSADFGNISLGNFQYLIKKCFYSEWLPQISVIYRTFVKEQSTAVEEKKEEDGNLSDIQEEDYGMQHVNETQ